MVQTLQQISDLKTSKDKLLYRKTMKKVYDELLQFQIKGTRRIDLDRQKQHKIRITKIIINGKVNPRLITWLSNPTKMDVVGIDDVDKNAIKSLRYGKNILSKSDRKIKSKALKINANRSEKSLMKDLRQNEKLLPLSKFKTWLNNKNKYDLVGVDTIPKSVVGRISSKLTKKNNLTTDKRTKKYVRMSVTTGGYFSSTKNQVEGKRVSRLLRINRLLKGSAQAHIVLGHETGHAYDLVKRKYKKIVDPKLISNMKKLAEIINPPIVSFKMYETLNKSMIAKHIVKYMNYRLSSKELFADAFSFMLYDPKNAKKISPIFYTYLRKRFPSLMKTIGKERNKQITKLVKVLKKDKTFLKKERITKQIKTLNVELAKLKSRKRIGAKTKLKIAKVNKSIKEKKGLISQLK